MAAPLATAIPELLFENCSCHYIVAGEGEITFPAMIKSLFRGERYPENIKGLYYRKDGVVIGSRPKWIRKLDHLSEPDYSLFDMEFYNGYLRETAQSFELMASRGCKGNCSFCYKFCGAGLCIRSVDSVLDEITGIVDEYGIRRFYFVDENFLDSKEFFLEFVEKKKKRGLDFTFIGQTRIDSIDEEICCLGAENGLICLSSGIESASQKTLDRVNKRLTIEEIEFKLKLVREYHILHLVSFIVGFPWDTEDDYKLLMDFVSRNKLEKKFKTHYLTPLPKTRIYKYAVENEFITDEFEYIKTLGDLYWERMINLTNLPDEVLDHYHHELYNIGSKDVVYPKYEKYLTQIRKIH